MYGPPPGFPYYPPPTGQVPWAHPMYSTMPGAGYNQGGYHPYPPHVENWASPSGPPAFLQHPFPVYHPPPYPPPPMYPTPPIANPETTGQQYGRNATIPPSVHIQATTIDSPSYQWPDGNVKLECTTGQEPIGWDDQGWMWRSSGARKQGLPSSAFKVDKRREGSAEIEGEKPEKRAKTAKKDVQKKSATKKESKPRKKREAAAKKPETVVKGSGRRLRSGTAL
ncbi:hypothetical protein B0H11DRAFT_2384994 [Mycena galericulata]|nr:hypothetical protein B0H11DRAFT_2384994 [Mycena galericulata]